MKKILIAVGCLSLAVVSQAQTDSVKPSQTDALMQVIVEQQTKIQSLNDSITTLHQKGNETVRQWTDSVTYLNNIIGKKDEQWKDSLRLREKEIVQLKAENEQLKKRGEAMGKMTDIVFKQCLLYPLEGRYDSLLIAESLESLEVMGISSHPDYKKYADVYLHLLKDYRKYNRQLKDYLNRQMRSFQFKKWQINEVVAQNSLDELRRWEYYKYFKKRNQDPWESILYLDGVVEEVETLLRNPSSLTEEKWNGVIEKLSHKE